MAKIDHEEICRGVFSRHLLDRLPLLGQKWERYSRGKYRPPDFTLKMGPETFAVEVTRFKDNREYDGKEVNTVSAEFCRIGFLKELEREALELGILHGVYAIDFHLTWLPEPTPEVRQAIRAQVFEHIRSSDMQTNGPSSYIGSLSRPLCEISKIADTGNKLYPTFSDAAWEESPELVQHVLRAFSASLREKAGTLQKHDVPKPWVLIFENAYPLASEHIYRDYAKPALNEDLKAYHSVFVLNSGQYGFMLISANKEWM